MAKSNRRRKQDQAKAAHKRDERARRKARDELGRQAVLAMQRLLDPQTPPAEVADLVAQSVPDVVYLAARMAQLRAEAGVEPQDVAEAGRQLLAAYPEQPPAGALAFAVVAAHVAGQEEEEHRLTAQLLDTGDCDEGTWLNVLDYVVAPRHPDETAELIEPHLAEHPQDSRAHRVYARAISAVYKMKDESERGSDLLARFADRSALAVTRETLEAFLERTAWGEHVRAIMAERLDDAANEDWSEEERAGFAALAFEIALFSAEDGDEEDDDLSVGDLLRQAEEEPHRQRLLEAFAADPQTPGALARRARDWQEGAIYGLWQMESSVPDPGVWVRELATGVSRYAEFPPVALEGAPPWTTWLGCLLPVDGVWRSTGVGLRLSPAEADAIGEYVDAAVELLAVSLSGDSPADMPGKPPIRFGRAEPYGVISEFETSMDDEYAAFVSKIVAAVVLEAAIEVMRYRAAPPRMRNTDGDEMILIDADIAVSGNVADLLLAHRDFEAGADHPTLHSADAAATRITWYGKAIPAAQRAAMFAEVRAQLGADAGPVGLPEEQRWVRGSLAVSDGLVRVSVNSRKRLERLMRILTRLGVDPVIATETHVDPGQDMVFGSSAQLRALAGTAGAAPVADGWARAWLDESVPALHGLTPREAVTSDDETDVFRLESLLRQFEYQAGLAEAHGQAGLDVAWLRNELNIEEALDEIELLRDAGAPSAGLVRLRALRGRLDGGIGGGRRLAVPGRRTRLRPGISRPGRRPR